MRLLDIDGDWVSADTNPIKYPLRTTEEGSKSKIQFRVSNWTQAQFVGSPILEEWPIPGSRLSLDFFLPTQKVAVEVQGEQHDRNIGFFHGPKQLGKLKQQKVRDQQKAHWCAMNNIALVYVNKETEYDGFREEITKLKAERRGTRS